MFSLVTVGVLLLLVFLWIRWRIQKFSVFKKLGIPGPPPNLIFGNVLEMLLKDPVTCHKEWTDKYGDVVGYYYGTWPVLLISDPDLMKQVLIKDFASFADRPSNLLAFDGDGPEQPENHHMINLKGSRWKEVRNMLSPTFTSGKLRQMLPLLDSSASVFLSKLSEASCNGTKDIEMHSIYQGLTIDGIGRSAFGVESSIQDNPNHPLLHFSRIFLGEEFKTVFTVFLICFREFYFILALIRRVLARIYSGGKDPLKEVFKMCASVVELRRNNPSARRVDLLQTIIDARSTGEEVRADTLTATAEGQEKETDKAVNQHGHNPSSKALRKLTDNEVTANAFLFFMAGYETTSTALTFLTHYLVNNPDVQEKVREEIFEIAGESGPITYEHLGNLHYTSRVIMESLRMLPPVYNFENRLSTRDVQLGRWKIPAGMTIQIPVWSLHYNPDNFEDPYTFNPDRFLPENRGKNHTVTWQPFGAGPRNCIGMRFADMEMKLTLVKMMRKFRFEPSEKTEKGQPKLRINLVFLYPKLGIHVRAVPI